MEALCKLMTTIGKKLDVAKAREYMNAYFSRIQEITQHSNLPARIKFMLEDLVDLRKRNWIPRQDTNAPKTIKEVHKEAAEKEKEKEKDLRNMRNAPPARSDPRGGPVRGPGVPPSHGLPSMPGIYGPAPTAPRGGAQPQQPRGGGSDWEVVGPARTARGAPEPGRKEISLAPAGGLTASKGWARGGQQPQQDDRGYGRGGSGGGSGGGGGGTYAVLGAGGMPSSQPAREPGGRGAPQREPARNAAPAPAPPPPSVSIEKVEEQASIILDEYLSAGTFMSTFVPIVYINPIIGDATDAAECIRDMRCPDFHPDFLLFFVNCILEKKDKDREKLPLFFKELAGNGIFTADHMSKG
jgi:translation initiation factor 4G